MTNAVPLGARAFPLPYEITMPLDGLDELPDVVAALTLTGYRHGGKWLLGFMTPGDRPRRILEVRTLNPDTASSAQAFATASAVLAAECERLGVRLAAAEDLTGERERVPGETGAQADMLAVGRFVIDGRPADDPGVRVADDFATLAGLLQPLIVDRDFNAAERAVVDAGFRKVPGGHPQGVHLVDLVVRNGTQNGGALIAAAALLGAGWTRGPERAHDQQREARIAEVLLDAIGSRS